MDISSIIKSIGPMIKHNSPAILTGLGVAGSIGSMVMAIKVTPTAQDKLDMAYLTKNNAHVITEEEPSVSLTVAEVLKITWMDYIPAVGLQVLAITCVIGAQSINMRRQAALISVATISETAFSEYQEHMAVETPVKDRKVRDDIAKSKVDANPVSTREVLLVGDGDQLFYEEYTDRYFTSTMQKVQKAVNDTNYRILGQNYASLNEFYSTIGLKPVPQGEEVGWTTEHILEVDYSSQITDDDRAAIVLSYDNRPMTNYYKGFQ